MKAKTSGMYLTALGLALTAAGCGGTSGPQTRPEGSPTTAKTEVLKAGAQVLQKDSPLEPLTVYLVGFHPMKDHPEKQMEAHHFCRQVNEDFAQCVLFDGNTREANLNGVEYIISEKVFETLPGDERRFWHPHNGEILSGQLIAPGLPAPAEKALMRTKMNSYGKTWHVWMTSEGQRLPLGEPMLAWSFNRDAEIRPDLLSDRDRRMGVDTEAIRRGRQDLTPLARPQVGVDALQGQFGRDTRPIPGVTEKAR